MPSDLLGTNREPVLVIVNPTSGCGRGARGAAVLVRALQARGLPHTRRDTQRAGHARELAEHARGLVVVVGGDGTLHEVVNGLPERDGALPPIAVLPCGSGDDFAHAIGATRDAERLAQALATAPPRALDLGLATLDGSSQRFVNFAGLGLVADVAARACRRRLLRGKLLYVAATLRSFCAGFGMHAAVQGIDGDGQPFALPERAFSFASLGNGPTFGGGLPATPAARLDDGLLSLALVDRVGRLAALGLLGKLLRARHVGDPRVALRSARSVAFTLQQPGAAVLDGEPWRVPVTRAAFALRAGGLVVRGLA